MAVITLPSGTSFTVVPGVSILAAGTHAGVSLPYSCKTGRCSTCKCKVISGVTSALFDETGITDDEKAAGWILSCVRTAETDVALEVEDLGNTKLPVAKTLACRIKDVTHLAPDVIKVHLRLPPTAQFHFIPGQYIDVIGPGGMRRSYSLAGGFLAEKVLELHIRAVDGGKMSEYWFGQAKANDLLRMNGPLGTFFLRDAANVDLVFLATGTGIAPVKAILESLPSLPSDQRPKSVTVLWGGRVPTDLYCDIGALASDHKFIPVLSRGGTEWSGARGYVQDALLAHLPEMGNATVYACGSDAMIHSAKEVLVRAGLSPQRFYSDAFVCSGTN